MYDPDILPNMQPVATSAFTPGILTLSEILSQPLAWQAALDVVDSKQKALTAQLKIRFVLRLSKHLVFFRLP